MFLIFYRSGCMYSTDAINLLKIKKINFQSVSTHRGSDIMSYIYKKNNHNTFPAIYYIKDNFTYDENKPISSQLDNLKNIIFVGGYTELSSYSSSLSELKGGRNNFKKSNVKEVFNKYNDQLLINYKQYLLMTIDLKKSLMAY